MLVILEFYKVGEVLYLRAVGSRDQHGAGHYYLTAADTGDATSGAAALASVQRQFPQADFSSVRLINPAHPMFSDAARRRGCIYVGVKVIACTPQALTEFAPILHGLHDEHPRGGGPCFIPVEHAVCRLRSDPLSLAAFLLGAAAEGLTLRFRPADLQDTFLDEGNVDLNEN